MNNINSNKIGLTFGAVLGGFHLFWSLLVLVGFAQPLLDFIFMLHMINPVYVVAPFSVGLMVSLVVVTSIIGYIAGYILAYVWNWLHK